MTQILLAIARGSAIKDFGLAGATEGGNEVPGVHVIKRLASSFSGLAARGDAVAIAAGFAVALSTVYLVEAVVTSMVAPLISIFISSFESKTFTFHGSEFRYGMLVLALISFALVLAAAWFLLKSASRGSRESGAEETRSCPECVTPISVAAKRCPHCTAVVPVAS